MKKCVTLYLDTKGQKHPAYYSVLKTSGHKAALKNYLKEMAPVLSTNFSKMTVDEIIAESAGYKRRVLPPGVKRAGGPSASKKLVSPFNQRDIAANSVYYLKAVEIIENDPTWTLEKIKQEGLADKDRIMNEFKDKAKAYFSTDAATKEEFNDKLQSTVDTWEKDTQEKSDYHDLIDSFIRERTKVLKRAEPGEENNAVEAFYKDFTTVRSTLTPIELKVVEGIDKFLRQAIIDDPEVRIVPEMVLDVDGWNNESRIDLFVYYPKTNRTVIYDFKFYSQKSFDNYETKSRGNLQEPAQRLKNNLHDMNAIQLSEYARMLEEKGITGVETYIIPFVLEKDEKESTTSKTVYSDVIKHKDIPTNYHKSEIEDIMRLKGIPMDAVVSERYTEGKISSIGSFYTGLTSKAKVRGSVVRKDRNTIDSVYIDKGKDGKYRFFNEITGGTVVLSGDSKAERDEVLTKYVNLRDEYNSKMEDEILNFVQSGMKNYSASSKIKGAKVDINIRELALKYGTNNLEDDVYGSTADIIEILKSSANSKLQGEDPRMEASLRQLFYGMSPDQYKFEKASNDSRFSSDIAQIVVKVTHKESGVVTFIGIAPSSRGSMQFDHGNNKSYTTVLGNIIDDNDAKRRLVTRSDKQFNIELTAIAAMMKELKYDDPNMKFLPPKVGVLDGGKTPSRSINLAELNQILDAAADVIPKEQISEEYRKILRTDLIPTNKMLDHYILEALDAVNSNSYLTRHNLTSTPAVELSKQLAKTRVSSGANYLLLMDNLVNLKKSMDGIFKSKELDDHPANHDWYVKITNLILALQDMDPMINIGSSELKNPMLSSLTTMANIDHQYFNKISTIYKGAQLDVFEGFMDRKSKHDMLMKSYLKSEGIDKNFSSRKAKQEAFHKLFKMVPDTLNLSSINSNLLVLKGQDELQSREAKALVRNMIATQKSMLKMYMGKEKYDEFVASDRFIEGAMPVQEASPDSIVDENPTISSVANKWKEAFVGRKRKKKEERDSHLSYDIANPFMDQNNGIDARLSAAGFDPITGEMAVDAPVQLEYNLDILFESMVLNTLTQKYYEQALVVKSSADIAFMFQQKSGNVRTEKLQDMLDGFTDLIIFETMDNPFEEDSDQWLVRGSSALSKIALALSPSYMILETLTNSFNLVGEMSTQYFTKLFISDSADMHFTAKDMVKAVNLVVASDRELTHKLAGRYGMLVRDPSKLESARFRESMSSVFNSKSFYWMNAIPIEISQTIVLIAKMLNDGSYEAHSLSKDGELVYDDKKDKRFFKQPGEKVTPIEEKRRKAKYSFYVEEIGNEGGLNDDGTLYRAYSKTDITTIHTLTTERFASLSADQKVLMEKIPLGIAFMRFKNWMIAKKEVWYKDYNPDSQLKHNLKWVNDPALDEGGYYTYIGEPSEGIFQSMVAMSTGLMFDRESFKSMPEELKMVRKKNIIRGVNDLALSALIAMLVKMMFAKDEKMVRQADGTYMIKIIPEDSYTKALHRSFGNAAADMSFFIPAYDMFLSKDGNPIPLIGAMNRMAVSAFGVIVGAGTGDSEKMLKGFNSILRVSGLYRGIEDYGVGGYKHYNKK